jgi:hypothetical protein
MPYFCNSVNVTKSPKIGKWNLFRAECDDYVIVIEIPKLRSGKWDAQRDGWIRTDVWEALYTFTACVRNPNGVLAYTHLLADRVEKTTSIEKKTMDIEERGVKLRLTVVDTPGKYSRTLLWQNISYSSNRKIKTQKENANWYLFVRLVMFPNKGIGLSL